ncbi:FKBP-type peptidyl-prolyl cis-trans isomerase [Kaarinaea lacus]
MSDEIISTNKVVTLTYIIFDGEGHVQEQSDIPISYLHGNPNNAMFPKVAEGLEGHKVGDQVEITLSPEEGFGIYDPEKTYSDVIDNVPPEFRHIGAQAEFQNEAGESLTMTVVSMENGMIKLDGNHPFAGKTMTFKITIKNIRDATLDEIGTGKISESSSIVH